jgi:hypothetical protein
VNPTTPAWLNTWQNHIGEIEDAFVIAREFREAAALIHEHDPNDERPLTLVLRGVYASNAVLRDEHVRLVEANAALRVENNKQDANADSVIEEMRGDLRKLQGEYAALRKDRDRAMDVANLNAKKATDFLMKNEALRAENARLHKMLNEHGYGFSKTIDGLRDEVDGLRVELHAAQQINRDLTQPDGELAKINAVLRDELVKTQGRVIFLQTQCAENARKYERQITINQSQYARLTGLRFMLRRIAVSETSMAGALSLIAKEALHGDDRQMSAYTAIQEAKG